MAIPNLQSIKQKYGIIGSSPKLDNALSVAIRVADTDLSVLITGESGVGKEVFSKIIHSLSKRKHEPFIAVNCGAIPEGTIDSELFGHEKGAFTGAHDSRKGYFEQVNGGTIFLDEIGEMPLSTQSRLLRVLESQEFIKVGSSKVQKTDVRIIAATNVELLSNIQSGKFRDDLYYRLSTVPIAVPPLRERKEDIPLLFRKFCADFADKYNTTTVKLDISAISVLMKYHWPGNIRELKNIAEQVSVLAKNREIGKEELLEFIPNSNASNLPMRIPNQEKLNGESSFSSEREILYKVLFDMKSDLNDLKKVVYELTQGKYDGEVEPEDLPKSLVQRSNSYATDKLSSLQSDVKKREDTPVVLHDVSEYSDATIDESLSLEDHEKQLIIKALDKHKGKRKYAALDLGISERTLYRKIKEYEIGE